jgi:uncharacterized membrane protein
MHTAKTDPEAVVYWALIFDHFVDSFDVFRAASQHALNTAFALFEITFARAEPLPWIHLLWLVILLALYIGVAYITVATEGFYVYSFLDQHNKGGRGRVAGYVFGILVVVIIVFLVVHFAIWFKKRVVETKKRNLGKLEHRGNARRSAAIAEHDALETKV